MSNVLKESDFMNGFYSLGVMSGMLLEVHCSMSTFGDVEGGAITVINALKKAVGKNGAVVMPSFKLSPNLPLTDYDKELGLKQKIKILKNDEEKSGMGTVSDTFKKMADVITGEGLFRVSAWGKDSKIHALGFQQLIDNGGYALLLGVDIYSMSSMHYVEDELPNSIKEKFRSSEKARDIYPEESWFIESWEPPVKPWYTIQKSAYANGFIKDCMIGNATCMMVQVKETTDLYRKALQDNPYKLYGLE